MEWTIYVLQSDVFVSDLINVDILRTALFHEVLTIKRTTWIYKISLIGPSLILLDYYLYTYGSQNYNLRRIQQQDHLMVIKHKEVLEIIARCT